MANRQQNAIEIVYLTQFISPKLSLIMNLPKWLLVAGIPIMVNVCFAQYKTLHFPFDQSSYLSLSLILMNLVLFYFLSKYLRNSEEKNSPLSVEYIYAGLVMNIGIWIADVSIGFLTICLFAIVLRLYFLQTRKA